MKPGIEQPPTLPDPTGLFDREPRALALYRAIEGAILSAFSDARADVQRTQMTFRLRGADGPERTLAAVWPPPHRVAGRPEVYLVLTFGLRRRVDHPRIVEAVEPTPGRWTHHLLIARPEDMDEQVMGWLREAAGE